MLLRLLPALALALAAAACGSTECDKQLDKAVACGFARPPETSPTTSSSSSSGAQPNDRTTCGTVEQCQALCFNETTCDVAQRNGKDKAGEARYDACLAACSN
jgi:hypothetical protein